MSFFTLNNFIIHNILKNIFEFLYFSHFRNRNRNGGGGNGIGVSGGGSENRRRFQGSGPGTGPRRPSQGRPLPPQDFNLPEGAVPLNRPNIN